MAPPDHHVEVCANGTLRLTQLPKEHHARPSGDPLFRSLAAHYGSRAVAVVLSGYDGDGAQGLLAVRQAGGATLAQDEATSLQLSMPRRWVRSSRPDPRRSSYPWQAMRGSLRACP